MEDWVTLKIKKDILDNLFPSLDKFICVLRGANFVTEVEMFNKKCPLMQKIPLKQLYCILQVYLTLRT